VRYNGLAAYLGLYKGLDMPTLAFNKPYDVLCRFTDEAGRPTLADYIDVPGVYPAGRLDRDSEGLLILTDDGRLQQRIASPHYKLPKVYLAQVERIPGPDALRMLASGVRLQDYVTAPAQVRLLSEEPNLPPRSTPIRFRKTVPTAWLQITLYEGRNRQVRRMTAAVGHPTLRLVRVAIGPISLGELASGSWRMLTSADVRSLWGKASN